MTEVVLGGDGRAVIHNRETGQEMFCSVPTALENCENSGGVWVHGHKPAGLEVAALAPVAEPEPVIALAEEDVLPLPAPEPVRDVAELETLDSFLAEEADPVSQAAIDDRLRPVSDEHVHEPAKVDPLDHDGDGKKGGSRKPADPERAAVIAALKAAKIKFFAGAPTEKLKSLLPG